MNAYLESGQQLTEHQHPLAFRIRHFSPAWFSMTMGVGISASILYSFPFPTHGLKIAGITIWCIDIILFFLFAFLLLLRFVVYPDQFWRMLRHPGQSMFLGCIPMGLCTIINMTHLVTTEYNMKGGWQTVYALWWVDVVLSLLSCIGVVVVIFEIQKRNTAAINATIILPIVPLVVAAASGGLIAKSLPASLHPLTLIVSFMMWGCGVSLATLCMAIYVYRLIVEGMPPKAIVLSNLLFVGPMGQGAFGIMVLGDLYRTIFDSMLAPAAQGTATNMSAIYHGSDSALLFTTAIALLFLSVGVFWIIITACVAIRTPPPGYNQSWWSLTFPIGTMTMAWYQIGAEYDCLAFKYIGAVFGGFVLAAVLTCSLGSIKYALMSNTLFQQAKSETTPSD